MRASIAFIVAALLIPSSIAFTSTAAEDSTTFRVPPLRANETALYTGEPWDLSLKITGLNTTMDMAGRNVSVFDIRVGDDDEYSLFAVSTQSLTVESQRAEFAASWGSVQGMPGLMGATVLQGRDLHIGDSWVLEGQCKACRTPTSFSVEPPTPQSPPATLYTVNITADYGGGPALWFKGRIHMGGEHGFPLLLEHTGTFPGAYPLASHTDGDNEIVVASPRMPASYPVPLQAVPWVNGRPMEGTPPDGEPSWADARAGANYTDLAGSPGATLLDISYRHYKDSRQVVGIDVLEAGDQFSYASKYARSGQLDLFTQFTAYQSATDKLLGEPMEWSASESTRAATTLGSACATESIPFWDGVRFVQGLGLLESTGYHLWPGRPSTPPCTEYVLSVLGATVCEPGMPICPVQQVDLNARTGYLEWMGLWGDPEPGIFPLSFPAT